MFHTNSIATPKMRLLLSSHVMQMLWLCALYTKWMHGTELALLSDYIFCCRRWWNEATWNPCRFFSRYTFYINTSTSYVYGFPDENLFFLFLLFLRFFLSHLLHVIIKCLDKVTHHVLSLSLSLLLIYSTCLSALLIHYNWFFGWWESYLLPSSHVSDIDMVCRDCIIIV